MQSKALLANKGERAREIRARLKDYRGKIENALYREQEREREAGAEYVFADTDEKEQEANAKMDAANAEINRLRNLLQCIWFRQQLVLEPTCEYCGDTWGLSMEVDLRDNVTRKQAVRAGCFWCCGWCYAHVLNGIPERRGQLL